MPWARRLQAQPRELGCTPEWYSARLLALSAPDAERAQQIADALITRERRGELVYETGRTG